MPQWMWADVPIVAPAPFATLGTLEDLGAAVTGLADRDDSGDLARFLDLVVRLSPADREAVQKWFREHAEQHAKRDSAVQRALHWAYDDLGDFAAYSAKVTYHHSGRQRSFNGEDWEIAEVSAVTAFAYLHTFESLLNAGQVPYLLSTPSRADGVLEFGDLVERVGGYGSAECGSLDLLQALLRLEDVPPSRLDELPATQLRIRGQHHDAIAIIRQWVEGGGLPPAIPQTTGGLTSIEPAELPVDPGLFADLPPAFLAGYRALNHSPGYAGIGAARSIGVIPRWPDLFAAWLKEAFRSDEVWAPRSLNTLIVADAGPVVHELVAFAISSALEPSRRYGVEALLGLMTLGRFDAVSFAGCLVDRCRQSSLPLARTSAALEQAIQAGGLRQLWPVLMTLTEAACSQPKRPTGLANLLALVRRCLSAVPEPVLPGAVTQLAATKGSTKAAVEARALVAAVPLVSPATPD